MCRASPSTTKKRSTGSSRRKSLQLPRPGDVSSHIYDDNDNTKSISFETPLQQASTPPTMVTFTTASPLITYGAAFTTAAGSSATKTTVGVAPSRLYSINYAPLEAAAANNQRFADKTINVNCVRFDDPRSGQQSLQLPTGTFRVRH
jgi:hypothetical protein